MFCAVALAKCLSLPVSQRPSPAAHTHAHTHTLVQGPKMMLPLPRVKAISYIFWSWKHNEKHLQEQPSGKLLVSSNSDLELMC